MGIIAGRDSELRRIAGLIASTAEGHAARAMRIVGPSGIGKTTLLDAAIAAAPPNWLSAQVSNHHIQASIPYLASRRAIRNLLGQLGDGASKYSSGLELDGEQSDVFEEAFFRTLEGLSLDLPLLLAFDDAQWADPESSALIERCIRALADRPIVLLSTERTEDSGRAAFDFRDEAIVLGELETEHAAVIVRALYPEANDEVVGAIADRAAGRAVDIVGLAEGASEQRARSASDVDLSLRRTIARDLALVDADLREFLQICSLIEEPIDFPLLRVMWHEERLLELIAKASSRFLLQQTHGLHFVHDAIKQAVRETIAIAIPLHRRIISAIGALPMLRFEDRERLAEQAAACGDRELQRATLMALGDDAFKSSMYSLAINVWERAIALKLPAGAEIVPFYARLSQLYNLLSRENDNVRVCKIALDAAREAGETAGTLQIRMSLIHAQWLGGKRTAARADLAAVAASDLSQSERPSVLATELFFAVCDGNDAACEQAIRDFDSLGSNVSALDQTRVQTFRAYLASRRGQETQAWSAIQAAESAAATLPPIVRSMPFVASLMHTFAYGGPREIDVMLSRRSDEQGKDSLAAIRILTHIARGEFEDAHTAGIEAGVRQRGIFSRRIILGLRLTAALLSPRAEEDSAWNESLSEVSAFQTGDDSSTLLPIAIAWALRESTVNQRRAKALTNRIFDRLQHGLDPMVFIHTFLLAKIAHAIGDRDALEQLASPTGLRHTMEPWVQAQHVLGRAAAASYLGRKEARDLLDDAKERFMLLGAPYVDLLTEPFESNARHPAPNVRFGATTRREREIAALVADGLTNREVAERLVLSERTVEGHVANLFNKLNVSSRTQIAAWYLRATSSVA